MIIEQNDAGEGLIISLEEYMENKGENFLNFVANYFNFKKTFQTVTSYVTREMEQKLNMGIRDRLLKVEDTRKSPQTKIF